MGWQPITTAPDDDRVIYAEDVKTGRRDHVKRNIQGEWECVSGKRMLGIGFYPTHWWDFSEPVPNPDEPVSSSPNLRSKTGDPNADR